MLRFATNSFLSGTNQVNRKVQNLISEVYDFGSFVLLFPELFVDPGLSHKHFTEKLLQALSLIIKQCHLIFNCFPLKLRGFTINFSGANPCEAKSRYLPLISGRPTNDTKGNQGYPAAGKAWSTTNLWPQKPVAVANKPAINVRLSLVFLSPQIYPLWGRCTALITRTDVNSMDRFRRA